MPAFRVQDDRGVDHDFRRPPQRIVSLVPSDTYSVVRLGYGARLVGRTRFCVAPEADVAGVPVIGGTKDADVDAIAALEPDLVIANQENTKSDILALDRKKIPVLVSFPRTFAAGLAQLARLARVLGGGQADPAARELVRAAYKAHQEAIAPSDSRPVRTFVPIWMDPLMTANDETFLADVLSLVGAANVFGDRERRYPLAADVGGGAALSPERLGDRDTRYPRVTLDEVVLRAPELILLPDEPHAFTEADAAVFRALETPASRHGRVLFCDGKDLMWYGARSVEGLARLRAVVDASRRSEQS